MLEMINQIVTDYRNHNAAKQKYREALYTLDHSFTAPSIFAYKLVLDKCYQEVHYISYRNSIADKTKLLKMITKVENRIEKIDDLSQFELSTRIDSELADEISNLLNELSN